ncbi:MAG: hypothetical protein DMG61_00865 [Acidobacteria bacterium]|nr:MAG: hypothetical protein DMG60_18685 [Acidobacteriota bacterium]PYY18218.1 MAG: hypothetical protein DMG61_00865 [Acidobacteriota bacterium]
MSGHRAAGNTSRIWLQPLGLAAEKLQQPEKKEHLTARLKVGALTHQVLRTFFQLVPACQRTSFTKQKQKAPDEIWRFLNRRSN